MPFTPRLSLLTALTTLVTLELLRLSGPVLDAVAVRQGVPMAALTAVLAYGAAAMAGPLVHRFGMGQAVPAAVAALALLRLIVQLPAGRAVLTVGLAAAVALTALLLVVRRTVAATGDGPVRAARAVALGVGADVALRLPLDLWDPVWRGGPVGWTVATVLAVLLGFLAWVTYRQNSGAGPVAAAPGRRLAVLGPALALLTVFLASPAFLASQSGLSTAAAGLWIASGVVLGLALPVLPSPPGAHRAAAGVLVVALALILAVPGVSAPATLLALAALPAVLAAALAPRAAGERSGAGRGPLTALSAAGAGCGLGYVLVVLPYQAHYEMPMPVPNVYFPLAGAALLAWAAWPARQPSRPARPLLPVLAAAVLLAVPPLTDALRGTPAPLPTATPGDTFQLLSWNVHYGVDHRAEVVPDDILAVIKASGAHVVVLQEVPRGWPISGGTDLKTWLEQRLDVEAVWAPAADRQFGNLILSSLPLTDPESVVLPQAGGTMKRSYAAATVELESGRTTRVATTHLQHADAEATRLQQIEALLRGDRRTPFDVLTGDFNAEPGDPEIDTLLDAGFRSAQDEAGDPEEPSAFQPDPGVRIDWIFGAEEVDFQRFRFLDSDASDHRPLTVTVQVG
ncbi:endonuclease/exonuclease/phosphatase family protein [Streptomyces sp. ACA25]|uniref:endonuclease/exonuclease/phosphatase family protein n=1 Tax=Streptomyces sp. ACA25 TaxID=3022596 RepID=UPI002306FCAF|nr:endonuclease/exonuclease/phosphatase family protein [Streptomyces sp. ACA25]MDB1087129.1 endonuclease/exonuclease/phosphatase family protein [Streptomyces sp. ACA25]